MSLRTALRRPRTWLIGIPLLILVAVVVGPFVYINFIKEDAPPPLEFADVTTTTPPTAPVATSDPGPASGLDGTWTVGDGSLVGYRVTEILFGQDADATGRTSAVTGEMTVSGSTIDAASFTVDMTSIESDEDRRDGQFHNRIMETGTFPTATFDLTEPIVLDAIPAEAEEISVVVTGNFTIHGVTKSVTFPMLARQVAGTIEVNGTIPVTFADYDIDDPSGGPASVQDSGEIEFLITFSPAA